jgi:hypothetical protein
MAVIDFNSMTLNEVEEIEMLAGRSIESLMEDGAPRGRALKAIIWVMKRREDPNFTFEQAGALSLAEASAVFTGDPQDPKD